MSQLFPLNHSHALIRHLLKRHPNLGPSHHLFLLLGETVQVRHDTDGELPFRQESNFAWLSGCDVPESALTISYEHEGGEFVPENTTTTLYLPGIDPDQVMWSGLPPTPEKMSESVAMSNIVQGFTPFGLVSTKPRNRNLPTTIHHLPTYTPNKQVTATINGPSYSSEFLLPALHEVRRFKTPPEIEFMRKAGEITSAAHTELMKAFGKQLVKDENEAEAIFVAKCRAMGAKRQAYTPIMAAGTSAGILHYVANDAPLPEQGLMLVDAGAEYKNYAGDVTRCIPIGNGGRFTKECREIYELVLKMQTAALDMIKPGTNWEDIQLEMHRVAAQGLLSLGILTRGSLKTATEEEVVNKLLEKGLSNAFFPHGVGHMLGLDTHDVGGLPEGRSSHPLMKYLRLRLPLEPGYVVTVEPGVYFNDFLLDPIRDSNHLDTAQLEKYMYVGGVRIEDNVLVTETGFENFTTAPKTVEEVEKLSAY